MMETKEVLLIQGQDKLTEHVIPGVREHECNFNIAKDGLAGIDAVYRKKPDIIFIDSTTPDISTYQICNLLKNNFDFKEIPVVILGASSGAGSNLFSLRYSSADYIDVSQDEEKIRVRIDELMEKYQHAFISTKNLSVIDELTEKIKKLNISEDIQQEIDEIAEEIVKVSTSLLNSEIVSLMVADEASNHLYIKAASGLEEELVNKVKVKIGEGISGWVAARERPLLVTDIENDVRFSRTSHSKYYTKSFISAPLKLGQVRGVINISNKTDRQNFNEKDLMLLGVLASHLQSAAEGSRLASELEAREKAVKKIESDKKILTEINRLLDKELYELQISYEINKILNSDLDYKQTINAVIELIESSVDYHFCGLLLLDGTKEAELMVSVKYPATEYDLAAFKAKAVDTYYQISGYNIILDRVALNRTDGPAILESGNHKENDILSSFHTIPLKLNERVIGLIAVSHSAAGSFGPEELKILSIIANHSVVAINNALLHKKIKELSITDGLTGLYCYRFFQDRLDDELRRAQRYQDHLSLIAVDIDGFKDINDNYGHLVGDQCLREVSAVIRHQSREVDILARYGGDEFMIILPNTDRDGAFYLAERIRKAVMNNTFQSPDDKPLKVTVSCGVASYPESAKEKEALVKKADDALYQAKKEGKNKTSINQVQNESM